MRDAFACSISLLLPDAPADAPAVRSSLSAPPANKNENVIHQGVGGYAASTHGVVREPAKDYGSVTIGGQTRCIRLQRFVDQ